jgi:hypothetical protein
VLRHGGSVLLTWVIVVVPDDDSRPWSADQSACAAAFDPQGEATHTPPARGARSAARLSRPQRSTPGQRAVCAACRARTTDAASATCSTASRGISLLAIRQRPELCSAGMVEAEDIAVHLAIRGAIPSSEAIVSKAHDAERDVLLEFLLATPTTIAGQPRAECLVIGTFRALRNFPVT